MSLKNVADEYFSSINPIAARLYSDINETKAAYDKLWLNLSQEEQDQILNESIIKPEACLQYSPIKFKDIQKQEYAVKTIVDDNCSYRDEHSAPFTFRTPSQRDLTIFKESSSMSVERNLIPSNNEKVNKGSVSYAVDCNIQEGQKSMSLPKTGLDFLDNW